MSEIKVNKISPRANCGTVTLGDSGDTFTIPAGATITNAGTANGFGATGAVNWQTTIKTGDFTAVGGEGYFINTTSGPITMTLPASPSAGDIIGLKDYGNTFDTHALTINRNSSKVEGQAENPTVVVEGQAITLVFTDSTQGWKVTDQGKTADLTFAEFIQATGGTVTTVCTNFKVHTFTGPGTFCVSATGNAAGSNEVSYMVVAGGGGGKNGGGGAGGFREGKTPQCSYTSSPIACTSGSNNGLPVAVAAYPVTIGGGGGTSTKGSDSSFAGTTTITSTGGGLGGNFCGSQPGGTGGSGGGGGGGPNPGNGAAPGGAGNTPPVSPAQGFAGGSGYHKCGSHFSGGGGGGATTVGASKPSGPAPDTPFGNGGTGATTSINGSPTAFAGGGGAQCNYGTAGTGGTGGGGNGSGDNPGTANTGGGGGGAGSGGSGIVIIRYKFQ